MTRNSAIDWMALASDSYWLWLESAMVIGMRTADQLTQRPGYQREAVRMVSEKVRASADIAAALAASGPITGPEAVHRVVKHYGKRVSANRRRLARR